MFNENDICSRCGATGPMYWHVCKKCTDKAQEEYREECKAFVKKQQGVK